MDKKATIKDIARICGVSITTVSRVINNKKEGVGADTLEHILRVIKELNYQPNVVARSMITKRSHTIGLVIPDIRNPFFSELARGVEDVCNRYEYGCFLCNTDGDFEKENEYIQLLRGRVADGILFTTQNNAEYNEVFRDFIARRFPFCFIERYIDELPEVPGVYFDNRLGAAMITDYLLDHGHRRIAFVSGPLTTHNARQRKEGYIASLANHGIAADESLIVEGNYKYNGGYQAADTLVAAGKADFTAVFASNDLMALGVLQRLEEMGYKVPEDISIAGFDHITYPPVLKPKITTVEIPAYSFGKTSAELLFTLMRGEKPEREKIVFSPNLIELGSVRSI